MLLRGLKITLVVFIALQALVYALQNLVNLDQAYQSVAYVLSNSDHQIYPSSLTPAITSPVLVWFALIIVLVGEIAAGLCAAKGAFDMWSARHESPERFQASLRFGLLGCGLSIVVWFGLFMVIGGAFFQMWQTAAGAASYSGSFQYFSASALILLLLIVVPD